MSQKRVEMHRLQELVRLHRMKTSCREVARLLKMSPNTEREYREALRKAGLLEGDPDGLPQFEVLKAAVLEHRPPKETPRHSSSVERWAEEIARMVTRKSGPRAIYDKLRLDYDGFDASLSAVKRYCLRLKRERGIQPEDVAIPVNTDPGQVAQVDFGFAGKLYDLHEGRLRRAWVFVMVLGYSRHMFARVVFNQRVETWLRLHIEAFAWFGGVVDTVVPDNLKAAVVKAAFGLADNPALNRSYRELARHYGFKVDPTPAYAPEKKGKVESGVKYVKNNFFKPRDLENIDQANTELNRWVVSIAGGRDHGTTGRRPLEVFELEEKVALLPLPQQRFELVIWKKATVHRDCHVVFEKRVYPVPWRFIGKEVWIRAKGKVLEVYFDDVRLATHERGVRVPREIVDLYLPDHRTDLRHRGREYWVRRADRLGPETGAYVREVFDADDVLSMLRTAQAIVTHLEKFPQERVEATCARARYYAAYSYPRIRDILRKGLDMQPLPVAVAPAHGALEQPRFARSPRELLQLPLEITDEPN